MIIHKNIIACIACLFGFSLLTSGPIYAYEQAYRNYATQFNQAIAAYRQADYPTAFDFFSRSAQEGHKRGQFMLGVLYLTGLGTAKDPTQGYAWLNVAAQSGNLQWMSIRDSIELMLNAEQIEQGKIETVQLKQRFGMKAQNIACFQQAGKTLGINHIHCQKKQYRSYDAQMSSAWQIISQSQ